MKKNVAMKDIAQRLGVSIVTVSKALSNKDGVGPALRTRIIETASEMGYHYALPQKSATSGCTVGVLVAHRFLGPNNGFYWDLYQNVLQQLSLLKGCAILEEVQDEDERACRIPNLLQEREIDGLILMGQFSSDYVRSSLRLCKPTLLLDFYDRRFKVDAVLTDNVFGSYSITSYLIEQGHQRIAFVGSIHTTSSILDRYVGYYKAMVEAGLEIRPDWVIPDRDEQGTIYATFELPEDMPTAFVCNCDETAYRFLQELKGKGYRVPEDISMVSFDNYIFSSISEPPMTTMAVDMRGMAKLAVDCIMEKVSDPGRQLGRRMIDGYIIQRESVKKQG